MFPVCFAYINMQVLTIKSDPFKLYTFTGTHDEQHI